MSSISAPLACLAVCVLSVVTPTQSPPVNWAWSQVANAASSPGGRLGTNIVYDSARGKCVLFGGILSNTFGDTWEWDGTTWTNRSVSGPSPRQVFGMVYDSLRHRTVLYGGLSPGGILSDTWEWDGTAWTQVAASGPGPRCGATFAFDSFRGRTVLFGGQGTGPVLGDTWEYDGTSWSLVSSGGPAAAFYGKMAFDSARGRTVLFGGSDGINYFGDTWEWNGTVWQLVAPAAAGPGNRSQHAMAFAPGVGGGVLVHGGANSGGTLSDLWKWDGVAWSQLSATGPIGRFHHGMAWDTQRQRAVLHGGYDGSTFPPETWELAGPAIGPTASVAYTSVASSGAPPGVTGHAMAPLPNGGMLLFGGDTGTTFPVLTYELHAGAWAKQFSLLNPMVRSGNTLMFDRVRHNDVLFGGRNPLGVALDDTWVWANGSWSLLQQAVKPSARSGHRMSFDRVAGVGLLFGGRNAAGSALADFWSWNGTMWIQLSPGTLPPARFDHGLAFDELRGKMVLYGGDNGSAVLDDIWEWNGSTWVNVVPSPGQGGLWTPGGRRGFGMAYDPRSERVVVHGGSGQGCYGDLWSWNGTGWVLHAVSGPAPAARSGSQLCYDGASRELLLFSGGCSGSATNDLWRLDLPVFWRWSSYGAGCQGTNGVPNLALAPGASAILGQTLAMEVHNAPAFFGFTYGMLGFNRNSFLGQPIPASLSVFNMPTCFSWTSADLNFSLGQASGAGIALWNIPLANVPYLLGFELNLQGFCIEPPGWTRWASVSNAITVRCGDR